MSSFSCFLLTIIGLIGVVYLMPDLETTKEEIHAFKWTTGPELNGTLCALVSNQPKPEDNWGTFSFDLQLVRFQGFLPLENTEGVCETKNSLFVLVGNPGVIWNLASGQCLHTELDRINNFGQPTKHDAVADGKYRMLVISKQCERDNPDLALFKYDKNKPQRLSFVGNANTNVNHVEYCCVRKFYAMAVHMAPGCNITSDAADRVAEAFFHEVSLK